MRFFILVFLTVLSCCNKGSNSPVANSVVDRGPELHQKLENYVAWSEAIRRPSGFIQTGECDSLLFSGLYGTVAEVDLLAARDESGQWFRRPLSLPECYEAKASASTISRDMFVGLLWWIWTHKKLDVAEDLWKYGLVHNWVMGQGEPSRVVFTPNMQYMLAELICRLGGSTCKASARSFPLAWTVGNIGFQAHLDVLLILLKGEMTRTITDDELLVLKTQSEKQPFNALFSYAFHRFTDGNQNSAIELLLLNKWFPSDRLPTASDRCEPWLWQRDMSDDWNPCVGGMHVGGDFIFVAGQLLK